MTSELIRTLSDFKALIDYWNAGSLMKEKELIAHLEELNKRLASELGKQGLAEIVE